MTAVLATETATCADPVETAGRVTPSATVPDPAVDIYAAVIRSAAKTETWYEAIYVYDRICPSQMKDDCTGQLTDRQQALIAAALSDLPRFEWVSDRLSVIEPSSGVRNGGALITLGPIRGSDTQVQVQAEAYCGNVCAHFTTWLVERSDSGWEVTGNTGDATA